MIKMQLEVPVRIYKPILTDFLSFLVSIPLSIMIDERTTSPIPASPFILPPFLNVWDVDPTAWFQWTAPLRFPIHKPRGQPEGIINNERHKSIVSQLFIKIPEVY
jgi:hypothetical protein